MDRLDGFGLEVVEEIVNAGFVCLGEDDTIGEDVIVNGWSVFFGEAVLLE